MRFEPAGMTDDPDLRFAASLVDYIFRRLAVEYMSPVERLDLGILTVSERMQPTLPGVEEAVIIDQPMRAGLVEEVELREGRQLPPPAPLSRSVGRRPGQNGFGGPQSRKGQEACRQRCSVLLPVRGADAAGGQLLCLPFVWDDERVLVMSRGGW